MRYWLAVLALTLSTTVSNAALHPFIFSRNDYTSFYVDHMIIRIMPFGKPYAFKADDRITYYIKGMVYPVIDTKNYKPTLKQYPLITCGSYNEVSLDGWIYISGLDRDNQGPCE